MASALAAARALKEKALTLLTTGEQPAPGATQHTVTEQLQITLVAPSAEPAVETFVVKFLVAQPTVESVIADLGHVPEKFDGLVQITSQNPTPGTTQVTVKGAVVEPGGAPAASGPLVIGLKIGSKATTVKLDGPVVVRKLTTKEQKAVICDIFAPDRVATVRVATKLDGSPVPRSGLVSQCKKTLAPKISTPATTTTPKTTSSGTVTPNGPAGGGAYIATIKNPPGRFQMTLPPSYTFASYGAAHGWGC